VYWSVITCSWRENILSSSTHSFLQFLNKRNFCTKMFEDLASFVAVWQNNVTLNTSAEHVMAYVISVTPHSLNLNSALYKQHKIYPANTRKNGHTVSVIYKTCYVIQLTVYRPKQTNISLFQRSFKFSNTWDTYRSYNDVINSPIGLAALFICLFKHVGLLIVPLIQFVRRLLRWLYLVSPWKQS